MPSKVPPPYFSLPPREYDPRYFDDLVRTFSQFVNIVTNPGEGRFTFAVMTALKSDDQGLEVGALFENDGFVKVVKANASHPAGVTLDSVVGSVSVVVS